MTLAQSEGNQKTQVGQRSEAAPAHAIQADSRPLSPLSHNLTTSLTTRRSPCDQLVRCFALTLSQDAMTSTFSKIDDSILMEKYARMKGF